MPKPEDTRVAFMGTPDFAVSSLKELVNAGYHVVACYSQPPKPIGRGHKVQKMPVHLYAESQNIPVYTPHTLENIQEEMAALDLDVAIVTAYGLILPKEILDIPKKGCVNVHASLLPRWRGAAPIQRALLAGDSKTGVSIMKMDEGLDTGPVIFEDEIIISPTMTATQLHDQLAECGGKALAESLLGYLNGDLIPQEQPQEGVTYASKISKEEGLLTWSESAEILDRKVRALNPWPGVWFTHNQERIKVLEAEIVDAQGIPGQILDDQLTVACSEKALRLLKIQKAGKAPLTVEAFLRGYPLPQGTQL